MCNFLHRAGAWLRNPYTICSFCQSDKTYDRMQKVVWSESSLTLRPPALVELSGTLEHTRKESTFRCHRESPRVAAAPSSCSAALLGSEGIVNFMYNQPGPAISTASKKFPCAIFVSFSIEFLILPMNVIVSRLGLSPTLPAVLRAAVMYSCESPARPR